MSLNNFRASVSILKKIFQTTCREAGMITRVQLLEGLRPPAKKNSQEPKNVQILARFLTTLDFHREYLQTWHIEHLRKTWSATTPSTLCEKTLVNFGSQTKKFYWLIVNNPRRYFSGNYISAIRGCFALKFFIRARNWPRLPSAHPSWDGGPQKN